MFNLSDKILDDLAQDATPGALREKLTTMAAAVEDDAFVKLVAREIVERTRPQQAIPEVYGHYRSVVRDGIEFSLSKISRRRLIDLVISHLQLKSDVDTKERLLELAKRIPTLHKLGQIIARITQLRRKDRIQFLLRRCRNLPIIPG
jgi:ubiquinone biosynthesis protein